MNTYHQKQKMSGRRGQAIVEFAIVLPILMMLLVGILEVGRLIFIYAAVNNASREAARYGSAIGLDDSGTRLKYQNCEGIKNMAERSAYFTPLTINISYDNGPGTATSDTCDGLVDTNVYVNTISDPSQASRVVVEVIANYEPLINLVPIPEREIKSTSVRTILGYINVDTGSISGSGSGSGLPNTPIPTVPSTPVTAVPSDTPTATEIGSSPSDTPTATSSGDVITFTPLPTSTPTLTPTITPTFTPTDTPTITFTPTMTFTPTVTPTAVPGCSNITASSITIPGGSPTMSLSITNPHDSITVLNVQVTWNSATGGPASKLLTLKGVSLGGDEFWIGSDSTGNLTITPSTTVTIPGNNATSMLIFIFDRNYQNQNSSESIVINLSTPGCESYPIQRP